MTLYEIIYDFLLGLFPVEISTQCLAFVNLASLVIMALLIAVACMFVVWCFNLVSKLFRL